MKNESSQSTTQELLWNAKSIFNSNEIEILNKSKIFKKWKIRIIGSNREIFKVQ